MGTVGRMGTDLLVAIAMTAAVAGAVLLPAFARFAARYEVWDGWLGAGVIGGPSFATVGSAVAAGALVWHCPVGAAGCGVAALLGVAAAAAGVRATRACRRIDRAGRVHRKTVLHY